MDRINWKEKYLRLLHISNNIISLLHSETRIAVSKKRKYDDLIETFVKQLETEISSIPDGGENEST